MNPNEYLLAGCHSALGVHGENDYPGFSAAPLDGFRHLRSDIERHGQVFLTGSDAERLNLSVSRKSAGFGTAEGSCRVALTTIGGKLANKRLQPAAGAIMDRSLGRCRVMG